MERDPLDGNPYTNYPNGMTLQVSRTTAYSGMPNWKASAAKGKCTCEMS